MKPTTREWVKKAENDFKVASQIVRRRKDLVADAACFFCQQCVEKFSSWLTPLSVFPHRCRSID